MKSAANYLRDILSELEDVAAFTADGQAAFVANRMSQKAVIRCYEVVGEIAKRVPVELRLASPQISWQSLIGFRDFLAHHYDVVDLEVVWDAVRDLPNLRAAIEALLQETARTDPPE